MAVPLDPSDDVLRDLLARVETVAVVGFSAKPERPSHSVAAFLVERGYRVIPVNPGLAGQSFFGERAVANVSDIRRSVDMIDVFRRSEYVASFIEDTLRRPERPDVIWTQLGVRDDTAAETARAAGMTVVQNRCPRIEIPRLFPKGWRRS